MVGWVRLTMFSLCYYSDLKKTQNIIVQVNLSMRIIIAPKALIFGRASFRYVRPSVRPSVRLSVCPSVRLSGPFFGTLKTLIYEYDTCLELDEKW